MVLRQTNNHTNMQNDHLPKIDMSPTEPNMMGLRSHQKCITICAKLGMSLNIANPLI